MLDCQALASRPAEKIFTDEFSGRAWVATGAPVVSTDPAITATLPAMLTP